MSSYYERVVVLRALQAALGPNPTPVRSVPAWKVAKSTPAFMLRTASGAPAQPYGERRVRKILRELTDDGLVSRRRFWDEGHYFALTEQGRSEL